MSAATTRREQLADAAIATLARKGIRGLTHRAVDQAAGVAEGSCSYYFRTRQALLQVAVDRLAELDAAEVTARPALTGTIGLAEAVEAAAGVIEHWITTGRESMLARYELALEATRRPELRAALIAGGTRFRLLARALLTALGAPDPVRQAPVLVACLDGVIFDHLAGAGALQLTHAELHDALLNLFRAFTSSQR